MKKYMTPALEILAFGSEEAIAGLFPNDSNIFNDGEFGLGSW